VEPRHLAQREDDGVDSQPHPHVERQERGIGTVLGVQGRLPSSSPPASSRRTSTISRTSDAEASALYGHPGQADLIGVIAAAGTPSAVLAARIGTAIGRDHLRVLSGSRRGEAEDLTAGPDRSNLLQAGLGAGIDVVLVALLVVASTVALSVSERRHDYALLRAVGATAGQVRGQIMAELGMLGALAGLAGVLPGIGLAALAMRGLDAHQIMPPGAGAWTSGWLVPIAIGAGTIIAELAGFSACSALRTHDRRPSLPGWRMARRSVTRTRRWFSAAPLTVKIVLVIPLIFDLCRSRDYADMGGGPVARALIRRASGAPASCCDRHSYRPSRKASILSVGR
jgi:hypothetical protein